MSNIGKKVRLGKVFREDGKTLIVAMDHGLLGPMPGIEEPRETIKKLIKGRPDAIMTNLGIIKKFAKELSVLPSVIWTIPSDMTAVSYVEEAVKIGVDAVKVSVFKPLTELDEYMVVGPIAVACEKWGMPLLVEPVPTREGGGSFEVLYDVNVVRAAARIGAELGCDFVKVAYTGSPETFKDVVGSCPVPVIIMGGPKMETDRDTLEMVRGMVDAGGAGVAIGRNIWQHKDPTAMVKAVKKIVHEDATVEEAMKELR